MLRIVKCYNGTQTIQGQEYKTYIWRILDGDEILYTCGATEDDATKKAIETSMKIKLGQRLALTIPFEEITQQEDKELQIKNKINTVKKDFE